MEGTSAKSRTFPDLANLYQPPVPVGHVLLYAALFATSIDEILPQRTKRCQAVSKTRFAASVVP
jgi:hypothetical protein